MPEMEYASLADVARASTEGDLKPDASSIARRSLSIFSRRGTETPAPRPEPLSHAAMSTSPTKMMSDRQQTWLRRRSLDTRKSSQRGTILKAVPPAERVQMSRLEREMAFSPNEEIMSAISEHPPTRTTWSTASDQPTQSQQQSPATLMSPGVEWHQSTMQRTESAKRRDANTRIGVWVDGIAHWDETSVQEDSHTGYQGLTSGHTGFAHVRPQERAHVPNSRPNLTVAIPDSQQTSLLTTGQPAVLIGPASIVNRFENTLPQITIAQTPQSSSHLNAARHTSVVQNSIGLPPVDRRTSSSTASSTIERSDVSDYSKRSSTTSLGPVQTTVRDSDQDTPSFSMMNIHKPLPRAPVPQTMRTAPGPPLNDIGNTMPDRVKITRSAPGSRKTFDRHSQGHMQPRLAIGTQSMLELDVVDAKSIRASPHAPSLSDAPGSPTLSEAEHDLQAHLGTISEIIKDSDAATDFATTYTQQCSATVDVVDTIDAAVNDASAICRSDSVHSVMQPPARAPTLPKRSRKREWRNSTYVDNSTPQVIPLPPKALGRRKSETLLAGSPAAPYAGSDTGDKIHRSESEKVQTRFQRRDLSRLIYTRSAGVTESAPAFQTDICDDDQDEHLALFAQKLPAEQVLLRIMSSLTSTRDLCNMAIINKGMYRVFKENELHLVQTVVRNESPAAWELREWKAPTSDDEASDDDQTISMFERTVRSYYTSKTRDEAVVKELKQLLLANCETFMRRETALSCAYPHHPDAQRFTDAFWRVWTFCTVFGSRKGREEDITGQLDWLKGGTEANNQSFSATVNTNLEFDMGSILLNAPDHFALGNKGGLSAAQLYDMTELWNCLSTLLAGYQGQTYQARRYGIFASCDVEEGDIELEEHMLEEWIAFVMTLGPDVILELAKHTLEGPLLGFEIAKANGWTDWTPSVTGSRATFLREPAARLYEERISTAAMQMQDPHDSEKKETARKRVAALAAEIRLRRQTSGYKRQPKIDMHSERAMSMISHHPSAPPMRSAQTIRTSNLPPTSRYHAYSTQSARPLQPSHSRDGLVSPLTYSSSIASARPSSPTSLYSSRHISPIIEGRVEVFNRLSLANLDGVAESTAERAVRKITEMGFTESQATNALRMTDMGDGLRVDRAVDMLLRT